MRYCFLARHFEHPRRPLVDNQIGIQFHLLTSLPVLTIFLLTRPKLDSGHIASPVGAFAHGVRLTPLYRRDALISLSTISATGAVSLFGSSGASYCTPHHSIAMRGSAYFPDEGGTPRCLRIRPTLLSKSEKSL